MAENKVFKIGVHEVIGGDSAISSQDGELLYLRIKKALQEKRDVAVDFDQITIILSSFLNASFGQLLNDFTEAQIKQHVTWINLSNEDQALLSSVMSRAAQYFKNRQGFSKAISDDVEDDN